MDRVLGADLGAEGATEAVPFRHYQDDCYEVTHARSRIQKVRLFINGLSKGLKPARTRSLPLTVASRP